MELTQKEVCDECNASPAPVVLFVNGPWSDLALCSDCLIKALALFPIKELLRLKMGNGALLNEAKASVALSHQGDVTMSEGEGDRHDE